MKKQKEDDQITKEDFYCIERALDNYAGDINNRIAQYCSIGAKYDMEVVGRELAKRKSNEFKVGDNRKTKNPMDILIWEMMHARDKIKKIRDKLERNRLSQKKEK